MLSLFSFLRSELLTKIFPLGYNKDHGPAASSFEKPSSFGKDENRARSKNGNSASETVFSDVVLFLKQKKSKTLLFPTAKGL